MSLIHRTTMSPSKYELLAAWLPRQPWFAGDPARLEPIGAYRFDDPEDEVGIEGHVFTAGDGAVYHVPLTYRGAPLAGGEQFLIGTAEHGVLGTRWFTDAIGDPVFREVAARAIAQGGVGSREFTQEPGEEPVEREPTVRVSGSGSPLVEVPPVGVAAVRDAAGTGVGAESVAESSQASLAVVRVLDTSGEHDEDAPGSLGLWGTWAGGPEWVLLAVLRG